MGKKDNKNHVLIIRLSAMGDVAMLVPCVLALTKKYPSLEITILTRKRFEAIFEGIPNVSIFSAEVKSEHKGFLGLYRLFKQLSALQIDAVADTHNVLRSSVLKFFFRIGGTQVVQLKKGRKEKKFLTQKRNKVFKPLKTTHQRYTDVFEKLGFPFEMSDSNLLERLDMPLIENITFKKPEKLMGIAPFAAFKGKMYPLHLMEEVIKKLSEHKALKILLFGGGENETRTLNTIQDKFEGNVINVAGKLSFKEELALISNLDVMLAMDSGNGHLAANYGVQVVTLWGVTHPYAGFAPFEQPIENSLCADREKYPLIPTSVYGNKFPEGYDKAIETVTPERVYQSIVKLF